MQCFHDANFWRAQITLLDNSWALQIVQQQAKHRENRVVNMTEAQ